MPGKQMAIDADLNAGLVTQEQAQTRRKKIQGEADFYGAMDGASKFVKGDAMAGIIIILINIVGGIIIGMLQLGLDANTALSQFTLLTVGDGLVTQIPALLISTASGIIVTRTDSSDISEPGAADHLEPDHSQSTGARHRQRVDRHAWHRARNADLLPFLAHQRVRVLAAPGLPIGR